MGVGKEFFLVLSASEGRQENQGASKKDLVPEKIYVIKKCKIA